MPPRRSRRTAGQDPDPVEKLEMVEKDQGKRGEEYVGKIAAQGENAEADAVETCVESSSLGEEKTKLDVVEDTDKMSTINQEDFDKKNSAENPDCGEVLQADDGIGEKVAPNGEKDAQSACRLGDTAQRVEPGPSGEQGNHLQMTKKVLSSSRRLHDSSLEEEFYSGEEEVAGEVSVEAGGLVEEASPIGGRVEKDLAEGGGAAKANCLDPTSNPGSPDPKSIAFSSTESLATAASSTTTTEAVLVKAGPSGARDAGYDEEEIRLRAQMKAAALERDSDDDEVVPGGGMRPNAWVAAENARQQAFSRAVQEALQPGLDIAVLQEEMEACKAIKTKLFPHQRAALAWCVSHERIRTDGIVGGLLADDMGLGKSLVVLSLILTNYHDGRPLAKPELGFKRQPFGAKLGGGGGKGKAGLGWTPKGSQTAEGKVGKKIAKARSTCVFNRFGLNGTEEDKENTFSFGVKKNAGSRDKFIDDSSEEEDSSEEGSLKDFIVDDEESDDEFDDMSTKKSSLKEKRAKIESKANGSSDEEDIELKELSKTERLSAMVPSVIISEDEEEDVKINPKLNLDGFMTDSDSEDDQKVLKKKKKKGIVLDDSSSCEEGAEEELRRPLKRKVSEQARTGSGPIVKKPSLSGLRRNDEDEDSDASLPDMAEETVQPLETLVEEVKADDREEIKAVNPAEEAVAAGVRLIVPPRVPAKQEGRRRATLLVCPTSLISHWVEQLNLHLHQGVLLKLKVHHGQSKALYAGDLETHDLVITSYGTLAAEFTDGERSRGVLLNTRWLRVVLDEGHNVKNHLSKAHKAALELDVERKWVVTGTPIQNNLMEFWSLLNFLGSHTYAGRENMKLYKRQIEKLCQEGNERGYQRLKVLMDAIAIRRNKTDRKPDGSPLVALPSKTVLVREVELTEEERICYGIFQEKARDIVAKFDRHNALLRNNAFVFALMMRLRQLCCHRELWNGIDWEGVLRNQDQLKGQLADYLAEFEGGAQGEEGAAPTTEQEKQLVAQLQQMIKDGVSDDCSVCLDNLKSPVITPCAHVFCKTCIETVLDTIVPASCPLCRRTPMAKKQLLEAGNQEDTEVGEDTLADMKDIKVTMSSSKVNAVLKEIMRIARDKPEDKIVVVSQFTSFLNILQPLLDENQFAYTRLDGSMSFGLRNDVLQHFRTTGQRSPKVLLLSLMAGGVGLNLTAANHLLLLDPAWNPATEEQCFDRTHRMGQTKQTFIYKFITKSSIEEKMVEIQNGKKDLITGAFHIGTEERRRQRIADIRNIFDLN